MICGRVFSPTFEIDSGSLPTTVNPKSHPFVSVNLMGQHGCLLGACFIMHADHIWF